MADDRADPLTADPEVVVIPYGTSFPDAVVWLDFGDGRLWLADLCTPLGDR